MAQYKPQDLNSVAIELARLMAFLENNQLVQANAVCQKLEGMSQDVLAKLATRAEDDPLWDVYKACIRAKSYILAGKTDGALGEAKCAASTLRGIK